MTESKGISGSALKIIAILSMLTDHVGAVLLGSYHTPYYICRLIGRVAFPIFCFLLVEGFFHTKNRSKYCLRLFLFALVSEIPFDLAFSHAFLEWNYQNVFFTLAIGLLTIWGASVFEEKEALSNNPAICLIGRWAVIFAGMFSAWFLKTDYGELGVLVIVILYLMHKNRILSMTVSCAVLYLSNALEISAIAAIPLTALYNGKRGLSLKYVFYLFYPLHLLLLSFLYWHI